MDTRQEAKKLLSTNHLSWFLYVRHTILCASLICMGQFSFAQQFVNGTLKQKSADSLMQYVYRYSSSEYGKLLKRDDPTHACAINFDRERNNSLRLPTWTYFHARMKGVDTLDAKGHGGIARIDCEKVNYTYDTTNMYLKAGLNTDTMTNFGWSLALTDTLDTNMNYSISLAMNVSQDFTTYYGGLSGVVYDSVDIFSNYVTMWYLRIGISDDPKQEGDSIGVIMNSSYSYTGDEYFRDISGIISDWQNKKAWYVHRYFKTVIHTGSFSGKHLTFRFISLPKIGPILKNKRDVFTCEKRRNYSGMTANLDNFNLGCITHIQDTLCRGVDTAELWTDNPTHKHMWSTGDTTKNISITKPGTYWVETENKGCIGRDTIVIPNWGCDTAVVFQEDYPVYYIPNAFTPNSDGLNDVFGYSDDNWQLEELIVYNRWGQKVYASNLPWDGSYNDFPAHSGVYLYQIRVKRKNSPFTEYFNGTLSLLGGF